MVSLQDARRVIAAAEKKAAEIGQPMNIAVADGGGNLVSHVRMDGAWLGSIDISIKKAYTSRAFDIATKDLAGHSQSGNQFFGIHASNNGRIMIVAGGIPLKKDGKVVGAIGVSGGSGDQDHAVAEAGEQRSGAGGSEDQRNRRDAGGHVRPSASRRAPGPAARSVSQSVDSSIRQSVDEQFLLTTPPSGGADCDTRRCAARRRDGSEDRP